MDGQLLLEEKHGLLKNELDEKLQMKHDLELDIARRFEELKRLEISLEKRSYLTERLAHSREHEPNQEPKRCKTQ